MTGYRNIAKESEKKWEWASVPKPSFESMAERLVWEEARQKNPRLPGEELWQHMERIVAAAKAGVMKLSARIPGEDDGE